MQFPALKACPVAAAIEYHIFDFTRYGGDIFQVCWTVSETPYVEFLWDAVPKIIHILFDGVIH